ncbi:hypothetical protein IM793_23660 [Pedobacter sp. MR2016-19]|uniref:hypothetical protein n=1 Tax=Pedobacter sp. MR2016-19 TaxID=2780089 RepID=UPI00187464C7|nr:hypothetical protein [Pedobacter sp. MR2016-19]MBE5322170.1 hypothetical protein [Pedobacter sp. MR2016-19]
MKIDFSKIYLFTWEDLYYTEVENEIGIEAFKKLCANQENSLKTTEQEFKQLVNAELSTLQPEDQGSYYMQIFQRDEMMIRELLRLQRYSLCLSIFSFFEGRLKSICSQIEHKFSFKIKVDDLNSNEDLLKYWNYFIKVFELDLDDLEKHFTPIKQQKIVRNLIAHQNGMPRPEQEKKINLVEGIRIEKYEAFCQVIIADPVYIINLLDVMNTFLKELLLAIDKRYIKITN